MTSRPVLEPTAEHPITINPTGTRVVVRVNGAPANSETIRVDGQEADNTLQPGSPHQTQISVEAMQEVSVQTSNFAAEYGQVSGGMFNFTMRSGTNQYHGSLYDYFTNEDLNAGIPFTNSGNATATLGLSLFPPFSTGWAVDVPPGVETLAR